MVVIDEHDVGKTREEVLLDLIYEATGNRIPIDKVDFGKPKELDKRKDLETDPNTFIPAKVDPQYDARYSASGSGFMYRRRDIINHTDGCDFSRVMPAMLPVRILDVLDQINECMPYPIQPDDVINYEYKTAAQVENGISLHAHPESLLWIKGQTLLVDTSMLYNEPMIAVTNLDGFKEWAEDPNAQGKPIMV